MGTKRFFALGLAVIVVFFALFQAVPYGRSHTNPSVDVEPRWDSPQTRALAVRACFDCHSNLTTWPWYSNVAPVSWLVEHDVSEGRARLNFSEWNRSQEQAAHAAESVRDGRMPRFYYVMLHPAANLTTAERDALITGLQRTAGQTEGSQKSHDRD